MNRTLLLLTIFFFISCSKTETEETTPSRIETETTDVTVSATDDILNKLLPKVGETNLPQEIKTSLDAAQKQHLVNYLTRREFAMSFAPQKAKNDFAEKTIGEAIENQKMFAKKRGIKEVGSEEELKENMKKKMEAFEKAERDLENIRLDDMP